jgi:hypothetical protein
MCCVNAQALQEVCAGSGASSAWDALPRVCRKEYSKRAGTLGAALDLARSVVVQIQKKKPLWRRYLIGSSGVSIDYPCQSRLICKESSESFHDASIEPSLSSYSRGAHRYGGFYDMVKISTRWLSCRVACCPMAI